MYMCIYTMILWRSHEITISMLFCRTSNGVHKSEWNQVISEAKHTSPNRSHRCSRNAPSKHRTDGSTVGPGLLRIWAITVPPLPRHGGVVAGGRVGARGCLGVSLNEVYPERNQILYCKKRSEVRGPEFGNVLYFIKDMYSLTGLPGCRQETTCLCFMEC